MVELKCKDSFMIQQILECGQCFRFKKLEDQYYEVIAKDHRLRIRQIENHIELDCSNDIYKSTWHDYFDMDRDYECIKERLRQKDSGLKRAIEDKYGLRILKQEPFEMLITFILSQNKAIPQIKVLVERLCTTYGSLKEDSRGAYYCFPTPQQLCRVTEEEFRDLKVGFRAPYLVDAVSKVHRKEIELESIVQMDSNQARKKLIKIKGVGQKVADCILLFAYGKVDVFPLDVWVRRMMITTYFNGEEPKDRTILNYAQAYFEGLGGIAQQYLFYYGRDNNIGKPSKS